VLGLLWYLLRPLGLLETPESPCELLDPVALGADVLIQQPDAEFMGIFEVFGPAQGSGKSANDDLELLAGQVEMEVGIGLGTRHLGSPTG
jgi:hypothetical protein